jgi:hypothetical protein
MLSIKNLLSVTYPKHGSNGLVVVGSYLCIGTDNQKNAEEQY